MCGVYGMGGNCAGMSAQYANCAEVYSIKEPRTFTFYIQEDRPLLVPPSVTDERQRQSVILNDRHVLS